MVSHWVWWLVVLRHGVGTLVKGNLGAPVIPTKQDIVYDAGKNKG